MSPSISLNAPRPTSELQPPCPACGNPMWLTRLSAYSDKEELRTFECQVCERTENLTVKFK
jgi:hypothetical protein